MIRLLRARKVCAVSTADSTLRTRKPTVDVAPRPLTKPAQQRPAAMRSGCRSVRRPARRPDEVNHTSTKNCAKSDKSLATPKVTKFPLSG